MMNKKIKRVLITGISGTIGSYMAEHVLAHHPDIEIHGTSRWHSTGSEINMGGIRERIQLHECDLTDFGSVYATLKEICPEAVFHFAAYANVRASFVNAQSALSNNVLSTNILFEAIRVSGINPVFQLCSTSEIYGEVATDRMPIKEDAIMQPVSPYAVSKAAQDLLGYMYFKSYGMNIIRTRMFTYLNPKRMDLFSTSFARQIARIETGLQDELLHGNLTPVRTIMDIRDAMEAYWVAATRCAPGEAYNMGSNKPVSIGEFLDFLTSHSRVPIKRREDPSLFRPVDVPTLIPDVSKFERATGWKPKYDLNESAVNLLDYWRTRVREEETQCQT